MQVLLVLDKMISMEVKSYTIKGTLLNLGQSTQAKRKQVCKQGINPANQESTTISARSTL